MVTPVHTVQNTCLASDPNTAAPVVCVQPHSSSAFVIECPFAVNDHALFGHPINYRCSCLVFYLFAIVSVHVICRQMKYCIWVIDFGFRLVELRKLVVHQVEVRTRMA